MSAHLILGQALPPPYDVLVTYGPLGVFTVLMLIGQLVPKPVLERERARADRAEAQRDALAEKVTTDVIPLVTEVQRTMIVIVPTVDKLADQAGRQADELQRLAAEVRARS